MPGFSHVPYNDLEALQAAVTDTTAAVILEVVQGEGGVTPGQTDPSCSGPRTFASERGALLIIDEVQTGFGRTGRMFAFQHYGLAARPGVRGQIDRRRAAHGRGLLAETRAG